MDYTEADRFVKSRIKEKRYLHSKSVEEMATELALRFGVSLENAKLASIFHDAERYSFDQRSADYLRENGFEVYREEEENPMLLHGPLASLLLKELDPSVNEEVITAIRHHTLGSRSMGRLGAILYIADFAERRREHISELDRKSILEKESLEEMVLRILELKESYYKESGIKEAEVTRDLHSFLISGGHFE